MKKKIMTLTLAALFTVNTAATFAGAREPQIRLVESGQQGLHLYMDSLTDLAKLSIFDRNGVVLFKNNVRQRFDFQQQYDLSKLPDGKYTFEIESGNVIKKYQFEIMNNEIDMDEECVAIFKPTFVKDGDLLDVSLLNLYSGDVSLTMFNPEGERILNKDFSGVQSVNQRYNLSKLTSGVYVVIVQTSERTFTHNVVL